MHITMETLGQLDKDTEESGFMEGSTHVTSEGVVLCSLCIMIVLLW